MLRSVLDAKFDALKFYYDFINYKYQTQINFTKVVYRLDIL